VGIEHQRRPAPAARNAADNPPRLRAIDLDTWEVRLRERLLERDLPPATSRSMVLMRSDRRCWMAISLSEPER
jgi:hypothetical protein